MRLFEKSIFLILFGIACLSGIAQSSGNINGISIESPPSPFSAEAYQEIIDIHSNWIAIIPYGFSRKGQPTVHYDSDRQWWGEKPDGIREMILMAQEKNLKVMLKPQVWMHNTWVGEFQMETEETWVEWEKSYREFAMTFAKIAEELEVELFCIGTEYKYAATKRIEFWSTLIADIRLIYKGELTYAANWDEYHLISFWHELDYIGINAYFPLSPQKAPSQAVLQDAWSPIKTQIQQFSTTHKKPILFTEYGYRSVEGAAWEHWQLDQNEVSNKAQVDALNAFYATFWNERYVSGGFIWKWHMNGRSEGLNNSNYTPQGKPALKVISRRYKTTL